MVSAMMTGYDESRALRSLIKGQLCWMAWSVQRLKAVTCALAP